MSCHPDEDRILRTMQRKQFASCHFVCVTRVLSSVLARHNAAVFSDRVVRVCFKAHEYSFVPFKGTPFQMVFAQQMTRADQKTRISKYALASDEHVRAKKHVRYVNSYMGKDKDLLPINRKRNMVQESKELGNFHMFQVTRNSSFEP